MIFVSVGTQLPFDRLIHAVDQWAGRNASEPCFAQIGCGGKPPVHMNWRAMLDSVEHDAALRGASLVVAHAGMGTVLRSAALGRKLLLLPRRAELGEHRDDHQLATARQLERMNVAKVAADAAELAWWLDRREQIPQADIRSGDRATSLVRTLHEFIAG